MNQKNDPMLKQEIDTILIIEIITKKKKDTIWSMLICGISNRRRTVIELRVGVSVVQEVDLFKKLDNNKTNNNNKIALSTTTNTAASTSNPWCMDCVVRNHVKFVVAVLDWVCCKQRHHPFQVHLWDGKMTWKE